MPTAQTDLALEAIRREAARRGLDRYDWHSVARPTQLPPDGNWTTWLLLAGRGFGKTRTGAEYVRMQIENDNAHRVALIAPTAADTRDVMVEGESGLLNVCPPWNRPKYEPSKRRLTWPNGTIATLYSADEPERLRGPQHDLVWADELAAWRYPEAWDMSMLGLRLGTPRAVVTTTPKPNKLIRSLINSDTTTVTRGSTFDNRANLAPTFLEQILAKYEGTRLGRQELYAEVLTDKPGALWTRDLIDATHTTDDPPELDRIVIGIDPAVTSGEDSDETGIIVAGIDPNKHIHVLEDASMRSTPHEWARKVVHLFDQHAADRVVAETNNGGDLVETTLRTIRRNLPYRKVTATRGKRVRAEPIAALYEQHKVHHYNNLATLEDQMVSFTPDTLDSPDRLDALVWAITELTGRTITPIHKLRAASGLK